MTHLVVIPFIFRLVLAITLVLPITAFAGAPIRVALNDLPGIDMLNILVAIERAKEKGVDISVSYLQSEGIAVQAVLNGQADVGMGTPYALIQKTGAPIRMFYQLSKLRFHPMVDTSVYREWNDLDGATIYTHGQGSGTEAIMNMMAKKHGIQYGDMKYVPGSGVRARAMLKGRIGVGIFDTERRNMLLGEQYRGKYVELPMPELHASDEALYANQNFLKNHQDKLQLLVGELLAVWKRVNQDPEYIIEARNKYQLLPKSRMSDVEILAYFKQLVAVDTFPEDGGIRDAFAADKDFYEFSGTLDFKGKPARSEDFWDFSILRSVSAL